MCCVFLNCLSVFRLFIKLLKIWIIEWLSIQPTMFFRIRLQGGWLDMLRKRMDSISLRQRVAVATSLHIPIYLIIFPSIKMTSSFNISILSIYHLVYSKDMFPLLFKNVDVNNLHCDTCEFAKHHRVSFSLSNTISSSPFSLIHSNI